MVVSQQQKDPGDCRDNENDNSDGSDSDGDGDGEIMLPEAVVWWLLWSTSVIAVSCASVILATTCLPWSSAPGGGVRIGHRVVVCGCFLGC